MRRLAELQPAVINNPAMTSDLSGFMADFQKKEIVMHDYSIRSISKQKAYFWISAVSVLVTPCLIKLIERIISIWPHVEMIYKEFEILGFSVSAFLVFSLLWNLFSKIFWKILSKIRIVQIPNLSGYWNCFGEGKKYLDKNESNNWSGEIKIEQEFDKISIKLTTTESRSHSYSLVGDIEIRDKNEIVLSYMYENDPFKTEEGLKQHKGFCRLTFDLSKNSAIGRYYTDNDRSSYGTMKLSKLERK